MYAAQYNATPYYWTLFHNGRPQTFQQFGYLTYQDLIAEARTQLGDDVELCYRYPDSLLISIMNRGLQELNRIRPDAYYEMYGQGVREITDLTPSVNQTNWTELFGPEMRFYPAVVQYVVGMTQVIEDEYMRQQDPDSYRDTRPAANTLNLFRTLVLRV